MKRNYFDFNGTRYYTGTTFIAKYVMVEPVEAVFLCYDTDRKKYVFKTQHTTYFWNEHGFHKCLVRITGKVNNVSCEPQTKTYKDSQINGLPLGWMWYIFLMAIATIFKDCIGLWIFISIVFFNWRNKKIKKEGTYIEW